MDYVQHVNGDGEEETGKWRRRRKLGGERKRRTMRRKEEEEEGKGHNVCLKQGKKGGGRDAKEERE